jgi:hypothetical protein
MKLEILKIQRLDDNRCLATLRVGSALIQSELFEVMAEVPGLNFSNMLFANILMFSGVLREFCTKHFESCEGRGTPLPWNFGDIDDSLLTNAISYSGRTSSMEGIREDANKLLKLLENDK